MNWEKQAEEIAQRCIHMINLYVADGMSKDKAVALVRKDSTLGSKYWQMVLDAVK